MTQGLEGTAAEQSISEDCLLLAITPSWPPDLASSMNLAQNVRSLNNGHNSKASPQVHSPHRVVRGTESTTNRNNKMPSKHHHRG